MEHKLIAIWLLAMYTEVRLNSTLPYTYIRSSKQRAAYQVFVAFMTMRSQTPTNLCWC